MTPEPKSSESIRQAARELGFDLCRFAAPAPAHVHFEHYLQWLGEGFHGDMAYLSRNLEIRRDPRHLQVTDGLEVNSVVVLGVDYHQADLPASVRSDPSRGIVARYAWSRDYHQILKPRLHELDAVIGRLSGRRTRAKCWVDTGPIAERDWAMASGMTFTGKNCCAINPERGSWLFLAVLCVPETLQPDPMPIPLHASASTPQRIMEGLTPDEMVGSWRLTDQEHASTATCGRCTRCLDACPTDAFVGPYTLDARRCISYWTIEARAAVPRTLRPSFGNLIFGCDICQDVCPWNRNIPPPTSSIPELQSRAEWTAPPLLEGFAPAEPYWLQDQAFRARFRHSALKRPKRTGMLRNVCTALGNWATPEVLPALARAMDDSSEVVREHAAWAMGQVRRKSSSAKATELLLSFQRTERHAAVRDELALALR